MNPSMKAVAVYPGQPNSIHLATLPKPSLQDVPHGRGVLVVAQLGAVLRQGESGQRLLLVGVEHRQQDRARRPVDVEVLRVARPAPVRQDVDGALQPGNLREAIRHAGPTIALPGVI